MDIAVQNISVLSTTVAVDNPCASFTNAVETVENVSQKSAFLLRESKGDIFKSSQVTEQDINNSSYKCSISENTEEVEMIKKCSSKDILSKTMFRENEEACKKYIVSTNELSNEPINREIISLLLNKVEDKLRLDIEIENRHKDRYLQCNSVLNLNDLNKNHLSGDKRFLTELTGSELERVINCNGIKETDWLDRDKFDSINNKVGDQLKYNVVYKDKSLLSKNIGSSYDLNIKSEEKDLVMNNNMKGHIVSTGSSELVKDKDDIVEDKDDDSDNSERHCLSRIQGNQLCNHNDNEILKTYTNYPEIDLQFENCNSENLKLPKGCKTAVSKITLNSEFYEEQCRQLENTTLEKNTKLLEDHMTSKESFRNMTIYPEDEVELQIINIDEYKNKEYDTENMDHEMSKKNLDFDLINQTVPQPEAENKNNSTDEDSVTEINSDYYEQGSATFDPRGIEQVIDKFKEYINTGVELGQNTESKTNELNIVQQIQPSFCGLNTVNSETQLDNNINSNIAINKSDPTNRSENLKIYEHSKPEILNSEQINDDKNNLENPLKSLATGSESIENDQPDYICKQNYREIIVAEVTSKDNLESMNKNASKTFHSDTLHKNDFSFKQDYKERSRYFNEANVKDMVEKNESSKELHDFIKCGYLSSTLKYQNNISIENNWDSVLKKKYNEHYLPGNKCNEESSEINKNLKKNIPDKTPEDNRLENINEIKNYNLMENIVDKDAMEENNAINDSEITVHFKEHDSNDIEHNPLSNDVMNSNLLKERQINNISSPEWIENHSVIVDRDIFFHEITEREFFKNNTFNQIKRTKNEIDESLYDYKSLDISQSDVKNKYLLLKEDKNYITEINPPEAMCDERNGNFSLFEQITDITPTKEKWLSLGSMEESCDTDIENAIKKYENLTNSTSCQTDLYLIKDLCLFFTKMESEKESVGCQTDVSLGNNSLVEEDQQFNFNLLKRKLEHDNLDNTQKKKKIYSHCTEDLFQNKYLIYTSEYVNLKKMDEMKEENESIDSDEQVVPVVQPVTDNKGNRYVDQRVPLRIGLSKSFRPKPLHSFVKNHMT